MHRVQGGRQAALLLLPAGAFTIVNNYLPGAEYLDIGKLNLVGAVAIVIGIACWYAPWDRLPSQATLVIAPIGFALIALGDHWGNVSPYSYAVYHVVVFVWIGLSQRPGTSIMLVPLATLAYVLPFMATDDGSRGIYSAPVAIPVCVLVGETIARNVRRLEQVRLALLERAELGERLTSVVADVNSVLDADGALPRICAGVRELSGAEAACFAGIRDGIATINAVAGVSETFVGQVYAGDQGAVGAMLRTGGTVVVDFDTLPPVPLRATLEEEVPGAHTVVTVPTVEGGEVRGALYAIFGAASARPGQPVIDALELLAGHVGAALRNAETHTELVRQQAHEQAVVAATADGMAVVDANGVVTSWNPAAETLTGVTPAEAIGQPPPFAVGEPGDLLDYRQPDGRWLEVLASPLPTGDQVVTFRDVSKPRALEEAKDLFLATTSHELRTPLTVIKGFTSTLRGRWDDLSPQLRAESLDAVADRTEALIRLVDHLLLSARANAEQRSVRPVSTELVPLLERAVRAYTAISEDHPITLEVADALPAVLADDSALDQALGQLFENAVKYSPGGGPVEVRAAVRGSRVVVSVSDRGVGLPPGAESEVFQRFHQVHGGDRRAFGGVGLGLHIVKTLTESIGATATAHRREGGGTTIEIALCIAPPTQRMAPERESLPAATKLGH